MDESKSRKTGAPVFFRTSDADARIARKLRRAHGDAPSISLASHERALLMRTLNGDRKAVVDAVRLVVAYRAFASRSASGTKGRAGRPTEELRDWMVGRARRIFREAWSRTRRTHEDLPAKTGGRGAIRALSDALSSELEFLAAMASLVHAPLPKNIRGLFDTPGGAIHAAVATVVDTGPRSGTSTVRMTERQRVIEKLAEKHSKHRRLEMSGTGPKNGPNSDLASRIRARLATGASVISIARELGCSPKTVRRYRGT